MAVEGALELLQRAPLDLRARAGHALVIARHTSVVARHPALAHRAALMAMLNACRLGDASTAHAALDVTLELEPRLADEPDRLGQVIDAQSWRAEVLLNDLDLPGAVAAARRHIAMVETFGACWALFRASSDDSFRATRVSRRAEMQLVRIALLAGEGGQAAMLARLQAIPSEALSSREATRLRGVQAQAMIAMAQAAGACALALPHIATSVWDAYWWVRGKADEAPEADWPAAEVEVISRQASGTKPGETFLIAAIQRELALLALTHGRGAEAKKLARRAAVTGARLQPSCAALDLLRLTTAAVVAVADRGRLDMAKVLPEVATHIAHLKERPCTLDLARELRRVSVV